MKGRYIALGAAAGFTAVSAVVYALSDHLFRAGIERQDESVPGRKKTVTSLQLEANEQRELYRGKIEEDQEWLKEMSLETVYTKSHDGLTLAGELLVNKNAKGTVLAVPGYRGNFYSDFACQARHLYEKGYNILFIYQRATGKSDGEYISFGINESGDVVEWSGLLERRFGKALPIFLYGMSMGATCVLMASGNDDLAGNVRGIIADCGFVSPEKMISYIMKKDFHLPKFPVYYVTEAICMKRAGFAFNDYDTIQGLEYNTRPVLFIHGGDDGFVPPQMTRENYDACQTEKELLIVDGARHRMSYLADRDKYESALDKFMDSNV